MTPELDGRDSLDDIAQLLLLDTVRVALIRCGAQDWSMRRTGLWCYLEPPGHAPLEGGGTLHISATPLSAPIVLARIAPILIAAGCPFAFARSLDAVRDAERDGGGKIVTVYPGNGNGNGNGYGRDDGCGNGNGYGRDDGCGNGNGYGHDDGYGDDARRLAERLHEATYGLPGPVIPAARPYRRGSLVHIGIEGRTEDRNEDRIEGSVEENTFGPGSSPALLGNRFLVRAEVGKSLRGNVYRAVDQRTGEIVIVRQARRHAGADLTGADARQSLRREAELLDRLGPEGPAPRRVSLFTQEGDLFLAQEWVDGITLRRWVAERIGETGRHEERLAVAEVLAIARGLVQALRAVHAQGMVHHGFTPRTVMVLPGGGVRLIDLSLVARPGEPVARAATFGYTAPEQASAAPVAPAPGPEADLFGLGACLIFVATGIDPLLLRDEPVVRPIALRLARLLDVAGGRAAQALRPLILGLVDDDPGARWSLDRAAAFLNARDGRDGRGDHNERVERDDHNERVERGDHNGQGKRGDHNGHGGQGERDGHGDHGDHGGRNGSGDPAVHIGERGPRLSVAEHDRLIGDGLAHLLAEMRPHSPQRLWHSTGSGTASDPCSVQHGAAGVLSVLTLAASTLADAQLRDGVRTAAGWIERRLANRAWPPLPGLYFGRSGTAWALFDAAVLLGDDSMAARAAELLQGIPLERAGVDGCRHASRSAARVASHGQAGAGLAALHLWRATGGDGLYARVLECAEGLTTGGREHIGTAGVGSFLLAAAEATAEERFLELARESGLALADAAEPEGAAVHWPDRGGQSEIGAFLIRLWRATGEPRFAELARACAVAARRRRWGASPAVRHGLAGDGHLFLDLAEFLEEPAYHEWARESAAWIHARHALRYGRKITADDTHLGVTAGYGTGLSGTIGFLLRLRHGGPRPWTPQTTPGHVSVTTNWPELVK